MYKKSKQDQKCRFGAPWPPMNETKILYPLDDHNITNKDSYVKLFKQINKFIQKKYKEKEFIKLQEILNELNISYELYILALRSTIKK